MISKSHIYGMVSYPLDRKRKRKKKRDFLKHLILLRSLFSVNNINNMLMQVICYTHRIVCCFIMKHINRKIN